MPSTAVRFGRIPKREKQRLLDEMQSYMSSLGEAPLDAGLAPEGEAPPSPVAQEEEAIGAISRAYHDIFGSGQDRAGGPGPPPGYADLSPGYGYGQHDPASLRLPGYDPASYPDNTSQRYGHDLYGAQQPGYLPSPGSYPAFEYGYAEGSPPRTCPWRGAASRGIVSTGLAPAGRNGGAQHRALARGDVGQAQLGIWGENEAQRGQQWHPGHALESELGIEPRSLGSQTTLLRPKHSPRAGNTTQELQPCSSLQPWTNQSPWGAGGWAEQDGPWGGWEPGTPVWWS